MKRLLSFGLLCAAAFAASAQDRPVPKVEAPADTTAVAADCLQTTGSRLIAAQNARAEREARAAGTEPELRCAGVGYSIQQQDLQSAGTGDLPASLRNLSPVVH